MNIVSKKTWLLWSTTVELNNDSQDFCSSPQSSDEIWTAKENNAKQSITKIFKILYFIFCLKGVKHFCRQANLKYGSWNHINKVTQVQGSLLFEGLKFNSIKVLKKVASTLNTSMSILNISAVQFRRLRCTGNWGILILNAS